MDPAQFQKDNLVGSSAKALVAVWKRWLSEALEHIVVMQPLYMQDVFWFSKKFKEINDA